MGSKTAKKARRKGSGHQGPPTRAQESRKVELSERQKFLKDISKAPRLVVFTGGGSMSRYGFSSDADLLWFLLDQVFAYDGTNPTFQNVKNSLMKMREEAQQVQEPADPELEAVLAEMEDETSEGDGVPELEVVEGGALEEVPGEQEEEEEEEEEEDLEAQLAELQAKVAAKKKSPE